MPEYQIVDGELHVWIFDMKPEPPAVGRIGWYPAPPEQHVAGLIQIVGRLQEKLRAADSHLH